MPLGLETPDKIRELQRKLYRKAKQEAGFRFYLLYDKVHRQDILGHAYRLLRANKAAPRVDGVTFESLEEREGGAQRYLEEIAGELRRKVYKPMPVRRVYIPKADGGRRSLGIPVIKDRVVQMAVKIVIEPIFEAGFQENSYGFRPKRDAHEAMDDVSLHLRAGKFQVIDADLSKYFGSLDHGWLLRFVEHRVGDPRILSLIRRWLKAGVPEDGKLQESVEGTSQGGSISVLLSNLYLHYVLDLWFERVVKPHLMGEAYLVRYIDDFVLCFQNRSDAERVQDVLQKRLKKFGLTPEPDKTQLVEFGRFAQRQAQKRGRKRPETIYFLGFTLYSTRNRQGNFRVGLRTEKSRYRRSLTRFRDLMQRMFPLPVREQVINLNRVLRGHYAYYGIAGNFRALQRIYRAVEFCWRRMLGRRSREGAVSWEAFHRIKERFPLQRPKLLLPYPELQRLAVL